MNAGTPRPMTVAIEVTGVDQATAQFDRLTRAIERASQALRDLGEQKHGGIAIKSLGERMLVEVKPVAA